ncbi:MAG: DPP IV N-terminal domain-containing protein [bacterium]
MRPVNLAHVRTLRAVGWVLAAVLVVQAAPRSAIAQEAEDHRVRTADYEMASRFTGDKMGKMVFSTRVRPRWLEHSDRFWYEYETAAGRFWYIVDPARSTKHPLFDRDRMAADITRITKDPYDAKHLPIRSIEWVDQDRAFRFDVESSIETVPDTAETSRGKEQEEGEKRGEEKKETKEKKKIYHLEYTLATGELRELEEWEEDTDHERWASVSPDGEWVVYGRHYNLFLTEYEEYLKLLEDEEAEITEYQLTDDGEEHYSWTREGRGETNVEREKNKDDRKSVGAVWSKDSSRFAVERTDQRKVKDLWVINAIAQPRPTLETYKYDMPGEEHVTQTDIYVFEVATREKVKIDDDRFTDQSVSLLSGDREDYWDEDRPQPRTWFSDSSEEIWFTRTSRDLHRMDLCVADVATGEVRAVVEERMNTYVENQRPELLTGSGELIWWSERDGWGHYYLYGLDGTVKRQITSGPFSCRGIYEVDEDDRVIYFAANGREPGEDPYYNHFYRIGLDGSGLQLLNPGDFDHSVSMDPDGRYFVDNFSRVDTVPQSILHDNRGEQLLELETADLSVLRDSGYRFPETFKVKADDGVTDLYGVMYRPFDFDPEKKYPIIAYVYPGPQTESVAKAWSSSSQNTMLAQFNFVVITVGNRGGHPNRSKWYHNYGYGDLRDYGLADKKTAIEQLAMRHDYIDIDRVGIFGHSGGGFMSTAAMLVYPDFFKVAVSSSGNHENNIYNKWWSEKHHGVKEVTDEEGNVSFEYSIEKNSELAENLKGHLLLTTGGIDNNVHPAGTIRMANALIKAGKRFDFFLFPGQRHGYGNMSDYWAWLRAEYFCQHLLGDARGAADMMCLQRDEAKSGGRRR